MARFLFAFFCSAALLLADSPREITRVAFASCYRTSSKHSNAVWKAIRAKRPQLFLFMGDTVYADTKDMAKMRAKYKRLKNNASYRMLKRDCKVMATWDDHDYGANDAGCNYPMRKQSQVEFQNAFGVARNDIARKTPGVYSSSMFGPEGQRLQVILLDTRYFRSDLIKVRPKGRRYYYEKITDPAATMLGDAQWKWLEQELRKPADLRVIVSSIQVISSEHPFEKWANFPRERERLIQLLKKTETKRVLLLSGDRHMAEISHMKPEETGLSYELFDVTSSGMTHAFGPHDNHKHYVEGTYVQERNFGMLEIEWRQNSTPKVKVAIHTMQGEARVERELEFAK